MLVGLAASVAMIQANLLLAVGGKTAQSFGVLDLMRLPLGILTGVGFIGGGAILRRGDLVLGVTTAATLWLTTVVGLCFGGGQIGLGSAGTALALATLSTLTWLESRIPQDHLARLVIRTDKSMSPVALPQQIRALGYQARLEHRAEDVPGSLRYGYEVAWRRSEAAGPPLDLLELVSARYDVVSFDVISGTPN